MKAKLEAIANVVVIVVALAVGYVVLGRYVSEYRARPVAVGDRLAPVPDLDWKQHRHTLVLALNTGCHFCEQSVPFYRSLGDRLEHGGIDLDLVAVFPNDPAQVRQFMTGRGPSHSECVCGSAGETARQRDAHSHPGRRQGPRGAFLGRIPESG